MQKSLLIRVFTPILCAEAPGTEGECATGYPVAPGVLLTCRHAVRPKDRDRTYPIQIQFFYHPDERVKETWYDLAEDDRAIAWESLELDAVLLKYQTQAGLHGFAQLTERRPAARQGWHSAGFPRVAKYQEVQHVASFGGHVHDMAETANEFELDLDVAPPEPEYWAGASGMPICHENTDLVIGILKEIPRGWRGKRAHATPTFKLLACPRFRRELGYDDREQRYPGFKNDLTMLLNKSGKAVESIRKESGLCVPDALAMEDVASRLLNTGDPEAVARGLRRSFDSIRRQRQLSDSEDLKQAEAVIVEAVQHLVPFHCEYALFAPIREHIVGSGAIVAEIPCALEMVAEIYMAAAENRPTDYQRRRYGSDYPRGTRNRPAPPITGLKGIEDKLEAIRSDLDGKFSLGMWQRTYNMINDVMIQSLVNSSGAPTLSRGESEYAAAIELEILASSGSGRYYLACRLPSDEKARQEMERGLDQLSEKYRALAILKLTGDGEASHRERRMFGHFNQMLPGEG